VKTLSVNESNDIFTKNGLLVIADGVEALRQQCTQIMSTVRGEMQYAIDRGIPYYQTLWTGSPNVLAFEAAARDALLSLAGVTGIDSFSARLQDNVLTYSVSINTIYGATVINGNV